MPSLSQNSLFKINLINYSEYFKYLFEIFYCFYLIIFKKKKEANSIQILVLLTKVNEKLIIIKKKQKLCFPFWYEK
jgi:uncharacterized membrane protein